MAVGINLPDLPPLNLQQVNTGLQPDDGLGDTWYEAFAKHNFNMERLANFATQVLNRIDELANTGATQRGLLETLLQRLERLERALRALEERADFNLRDILNRLALLERRLRSLPWDVYGAERPLVVLGMGKLLPDSYDNIKALAFGNHQNTESVRLLGLFTGGNPIRALMYNFEWADPQEDQEVNTDTEAHWFLFFSRPVKAQAVVTATYTNHYQGDRPASFSNLQVVPLGLDGQEIRTFQTDTTYTKGSIVASAQDLFAQTTTWYICVVDQTTNQPPGSGWDTTPKCTDRYKITADVASQAGRRYLKLGLDPQTQIPEKEDGSGRTVVMPCADRGLLTVVAAGKSPPYKNCRSSGDSK